mmetsp:Transcript_42077/g.78187  ORF Transcript_42077/g.78187 Transcript_42077/m.78187 type:complete len:83 (+) Transcript_42077:433-681(+)
MYPMKLCEEKLSSCRMDFETVLFHYKQRVADAVKRCATRDGTGDFFNDRTSAVARIRKGSCPSQGSEATASLRLQARTGILG